MRKRNFKTYLLLAFRHMGMLCRKSKPKSKGLRIARTVYPDYQLSSIESERGVWAENIKSGRKSCGFNTDTRVCSKCGVTSIEEFAVDCLSISKKIRNGCDKTK